MFRSGVLSENCPQVEPDSREVMRFSRGSPAESRGCDFNQVGGKDAVVRAEPRSRGALAVVVIVVASDAVVLLLALVFLFRRLF